MAKKKQKPKARKPAPVKAAKGVSATEVGRHLEMSRQRVGQLEAEGVFPRLANGRFDLTACRIAYIRWLKDENRRGSKAAGASVFQVARTREIEQRIAREDGKLIPIDEVQAGITDILGTYRAELSGVAAASTRDLDVRAAIESNLNGAIERCRTRFEAMEGDVRAGREVQLDGDEADI